MSKYNNVKTEYGGRVFHSKKEAEFAQTLDTLKKAKNLRERVILYTCQSKYPVFINGIKICDYIADFVVTHADGWTEVVDVKGYKTAMYRLKKKMVEAYYGIKIIEV